MSDKYSVEANGDDGKFRVEADYLELFYYHDNVAVGGYGIDEDGCRNYIVQFESDYGPLIGCPLQYVSSDLSLGNRYLKPTFPGRARYQTCSCCGKVFDSKGAHVKYVADIRYFIPDEEDETLDVETLLVAVACVDCEPVEKRPGVAAAANASEATPSV